MSQLQGSAGRSIPPPTIPRLAAAAARLAARHEDSNPTSIAAVATTRAKAVEVMFKGTRMPSTESDHVYAVVMTGRFASYRGGMHAYPPHEYLPHIGSALVVIFDAQTLGSLDVRLGDGADPALLSKLGPVTLLKGKQAG